MECRQILSDKITARMKESYELKVTNHEGQLTDNQMFSVVSLRLLLFLIVLFCMACSQKIQFVEQQEMQLATPIIESDSVFFTQDLKVNLRLGLENVEMRYTLDGSEPILTSNLYADEIILTKSATVKTRAFHSDYLPSEVVSTQFIKANDSNPIKNITLNREPHENYQGTGVSGLTDYVKGPKDYKSDAWLAFSGGDLELTIETADNEPINRFIVSLFSHQSAWIFLPQKIEIYTANQKENYTLAAAKNIAITEENSESEFRFVEVEFSKRKARFVKVILKNIREIPAWHPGKGRPPWLFIDEVLLK